MMELRREFLYQRFLARVFEGHSSWVLKGGIGLLTRLPGARHSRDIDLLHLTADPAQAEEEIRRFGRRDLGDHLRFEIVRSTVLSVHDALRLKTQVYAGTSQWERFDIDVSCERHFVAAVEPVQPRPVLEMQGVPELPAFLLYPLVDQIADKVTAMYETHGGASVEPVPRPRRPCPAGRCGGTRRRAPAGRTERTREACPQPGHPALSHPFPAPGLGRRLPRNSAAQLAPR